MRTLHATPLKRKSISIKRGHDIGIRFEVLDVRRRQVRLESFGFRTIRGPKWDRRTSH